jgi:hypothetical protein
MDDLTVHYVYSGFMFAAGIWIFLVIMNNADIIWDLGKVVVLIGVPILLFIAGMVGLFWGMRELNAKIEEHRVLSDIHPAPPSNPAATPSYTRVSSGSSAARNDPTPPDGRTLPTAAQPPRVQRPTPEQVCSHTEYLPLAKPALYSDCLQFWNAYLTSRKTDHGVVESAMRFDLQATNKAQTLCIFEVLTSDKWKQTSAAAMEDGFQSCIDRNRKYDSVR